MRRQATMKKLLSANGLIPHFAGLVFTVFLGLTVAQGQISVTITGTNITCAGLCDGTATAYPLGGTSPYTYLWNPIGGTTNAVTGLCTGTYTVIVSDAIGATATGTVTITQPPVLFAGFTSINATCPTCSDGWAFSNANGGTSPYTYLWSPGGETTQTITGLPQGSYTLCVTDANGCISCEIFNISWSNGINETLSADIISVFPNPFSFSTTLQSDNLFHNATLSVYNSQGQQVKQFVIRNSSSFVIRRDNLPSGLYFVRLTEENKTLATGKVIITND